MHFSWNEETIAWFKAASAYTGFHRKLAERLLATVGGAEVLYDIGCGLGLLSQELAPRVGKIVCVDINQEALASLERDAAAKGIGNISTLLGDCYRTEPACDVVLMSYFGSSSLDYFLPYCRRLISIVDLDERSSLGGSSLSGARRSRQTADKLERRLMEAGRSYTMEPISLEFGQPFTSRADAVRFLQVYYRCSPEEAEAFITGRLVKAEQAAYEYYLPYTKTMGVFRIEGGMSSCMCS
ncbi:class I SAM-dependent methyltransferase [Paenibacillus sp. YN15]|uniref:class I SAM-dependent methyltransferase n=1 Tax=Paenibacillus sp. YN15 TaxID=1742774 RepID=UPI000DCCE229|nr:class I SAM-dependent methyltransferase [Paenibacillus sp. YN15]RAU93465.1 SAM-dependent methyltransferase [Paenibacillus sp. YN15]